MNNNKQFTAEEILEMAKNSLGNLWEEIFDTKTEKPPLGVAPRFIREEQRIMELKGGIDRFLEAGKQIPDEWLEEYNELISKYEYRQKVGSR